MSRTSAPTSRSVRRAAIASPSMPRSIEPMLATASEGLPRDLQRYAFEYKWDGVRAICYADGTSIRLESRNLLDMTSRYPELYALQRALDGRRVILDGEIVALDDLDRPSFALLQERMHLKNELAIRRIMERIPVYYFIFDLLWIDGQSVMSEPFLKRRERLEELTLAGPGWRVSPAYVGEAEQMLLAAEQNELEGLVAKEIDSTYLPGRRSQAWLKIKIVQKQEFVICGWLGEKETPQGLGSLIMGYYEPAGRGHRKLRYAGRVGTGFTAASRARLLKRLRAIERPDSPLDEPLPPPSRFSRPMAGAHFCDPKLVAEIEYRRWPAGGLIQHASYQGLREDKAPTDVICERSCMT